MWQRASRRHCWRRSTSTTWPACSPGVRRCSGTGGRCSCGLPAAARSSRPAAAPSSGWLRWWAASGWWSGSSCSRCSATRRWRRSSLPCRSRSRRWPSASRGRWTSSRGLPLSRCSSSIGPTSPAFAPAPRPASDSGGRLSPSRAREPLAELGVAADGLAAVQLPAELACRAVALRDHVVRMDRLQVHLPREEEVRVVELWIRGERVSQRDPHRVLHEARLQVRVLDDEQLVGPLQELVDRRAHRALDDPDELLGVERPLGADEERAAPPLVVRRERDELEDPLDVELAEAGLAEPLGRALADEALGTRAGVDSRRLYADDPARPGLRGRC